jgi:hypothetical protein
VGIATGSRRALDAERPATSRARSALPRCCQPRPQARRPVRDSRGASVLVRPPDPRSSRDRAVLRASVRSVRRSCADHRGTPRDPGFGPAPADCLSDFGASIASSNVEVEQTMRALEVGASVVFLSSPARSGGRASMAQGMGMVRAGVGADASGEVTVSGDGCAAGDGASGARGAGGGVMGG